MGVGREVACYLQVPSLLYKRAASTYICRHSSALQRRTVSSCRHGNGQSLLVAGAVMVAVGSNWWPIGVSVPTCLPVQGGVELVDGGGDPEPGLQHHLLPLEADVLGPPDEPGQVAGGLDVLADPEVPGSLLEQRVHDPLHLLPLHRQRGGGNLLPLPLLSFFIDHLLGYKYNLQGFKRLYKRIKEQ